MKEWILQNWFDLSVDEFFSVFYADKKFQLQLQEDCGGIDIEIGEWNDISDEDPETEGWEEKLRIVTFKNPINAPRTLLKMLGTSTTEATLKQYYAFEDSDGTRLLRMRQRVYTQGVPLSNLYYVEVISTATQMGERRLDFTIRCKTECQGFAYGLKPIIDTVLYTESRKSHMRLLQLARAFAPSPSGDSGQDAVGSATCQPSPAPPESDGNGAPSSIPTDGTIACIRDMEKKGDDVSEISEDTWISAMMDGTLATDDGGTGAGAGVNDLSERLRKQASGAPEKSHTQESGEVWSVVQERALRANLELLRSLRADGLIDQEISSDHQRQLLMSHFGNSAHHDATRFHGGKTPTGPPGGTSVGIFNDPGGDRNATEMRRRHRRRHQRVSASTRLPHDGMDNPSLSKIWGFIRQRHWRAASSMLQVLLSKHPNMKARQGLVAWFFVAGLTHVLLDGGYVIFGGSTNVNMAGWVMAPWKVYSESGDDRYRDANTLIITLQLMFGFIHGPLCISTGFGILREKRWYPLIATITCFAELYGRVILIATYDSLDQKIDDMSSSFLSVFVSWTLIWMLVPLVLLVYFLPHAVRGLPRDDDDVLNMEEETLARIGRAHNSRNGGDANDVEGGTVVNAALLSSTQNQIWNTSV
eukprot:Rmarinus@m.3615